MPETTLQRPETQNPETRREEIRANYRLMGRLFLWGGWGACLVTLALGGYIIDRMRVEIQKQTAALKLLPERRALAALSDAAIMVPLRGAGTWERASGRLFLGIDGGRRVLLATQDLTPLPGGQSYKLWLVRSGEPVLAGAFSASETGHAFLDADLPGPLRDVQAATVTVEPTDAPATQSGPIVMAGQF